VSNIFNMPEAKTGGVPDGSYEATFVGVEHVPANLEKGYKPAIKLVFEIAKGEHTGSKASRIAGIANGPKAHLPKLLKNIMKADPLAGAIDLGPFVGRPYMVSVAGNKIEAIIPLW